ncbi:actin-related protein 10 [Entomortierella parvispora]|uniref:Actin-related protein 10 n=1 Tax=Entomortierella parvispora TaxID=205924 RepID=A0A9P3H6S5_9FUNG|nr:actin-related protein 10 [Entomortierella parvispora]
MALPLSKIRDLSFKTSIYGIEERIVLDIGSCYLKCGFSGEARPRHFLSMFLSEEALDDYLGLNAISEQHVGHECGESCNLRSNQNCRGINPYEYAELYQLDMMRKNSSGQTEQERLQILEERLADYLNDVYFKYLLTDPKQRKVIICESPLAPIALKESIAKVLFEKLQVPSVSFTPNHLLALLTTGTATGLVIDCGHLETTVLPIYSSRPLMPFIRTTPRAGKFLSTHLKQLLKEKCPISLVDNPTDLRIIPEGMLTSAFLETIKTRLLFASPLIINARDNIGEDEMNNNYRDVSTSTEVNVEVWLHEEQARGKLAIPGWIRERASECLFNGDEDAESLTDVILETVSKVPSDLRRPMISSLLLIGGTAQLPNLQNRLLQEIRRSLQTNKRWKALSGLADAVRFLDDFTPAEASLAAAAAAATSTSAAGLGASSSSPMDVDPETSAPPRTTTRDKDPRKKKKDQPKKVYQSSGKVFMPNCRGWIGGSLVGSLKSSGPELLRENFTGTVPDWSTFTVVSASSGLYSSQSTSSSSTGLHQQQQQPLHSEGTLAASALSISY